MPSFVISVNQIPEVFVNLFNSSSIGVHLSWVGSENPDEEGLLLFNVGGGDGVETVRWNVPDLSMGDEITIKISDESVVDSATSRFPTQPMKRG